MSGRPRCSPTARCSPRSQIASMYFCAAFIPPRRTHPRGAAGRCSRMLNVSMRCSMEQIARRAPLWTADALRVSLPRAARGLATPPNHNRWHWFAVCGKRTKVQRVRCRSNSGIRCSKFDLHKGFPMMLLMDCGVTPGKVEVAAWSGFKISLCFRFFRFVLELFVTVIAKRRS